MTPLSPQDELDRTLALLRSYEDLETDQMDDASYVARGNGFCDSKYSDDFILLRIAQLTARASELKKMLGNQGE